LLAEFISSANSLSAAVSKFSKGYKFKSDLASRSSVKISCVAGKYPSFVYRNLGCKRTF